MNAMMGFLVSLVSSTCCVSVSGSDSLRASRLGVSRGVAGMESILRKVVGEIESCDRVRGAGLYSLVREVVWVWGCCLWDGEWEVEKNN